MITKCQHTGFEFEAATSRSKNHPLVASFLNEASKQNGHYSGASQAAKQLVSEATGFDSIEELLSSVEDAYESWKTTGKARKVVQTHKEKVQAGERRIGKFLGLTEGQYEEATDGNPFSDPR